MTTFSEAIKKTHQKTNAVEPKNKTPEEPKDSFSPLIAAIIAAILLFVLFAVFGAVIQYKNNSLETVNYRGFDFVKKHF